MCKDGIIVFSSCFFLPRGGGYSSSDNSPQTCSGPDARPLNGLISDGKITLSATLGQPRDMEGNYNYMAYNYTLYKSEEAKKFQVEE